MQVFHRAIGAGFFFSIAMAGCTSVPENNPSNNPRDASADSATPLSPDVISRDDVAASSVDAMVAMDAATVPACGNGTLDEGEECEDGNRRDGDLCSSMCLLTDPTRRRVDAGATFGDVVARRGDANEVDAPVDARRTYVGQTTHKVCWVSSNLNCPSSNLDTCPPGCTASIPENVGSGYSCTITCGGSVSNGTTVTIVGMAPTPMVAPLDSGVDVRETGTGRL